MSVGVGPARHVGHVPRRSPDVVAGLEVPPAPPSPVWQLAVAAVGVVAVVAAALTWAQVVDRLRAPEPIATHGAPEALVWSGRVFRSEAELAAWLRKKGVAYERWVRAHPAAVSILREPATAGRQSRPAPVETPARDGTGAPSPGGAQASSAPNESPAMPVAPLVVLVAAATAAAALAVRVSVRLRLGTQAVRLVRRGPAAATRGAVVLVGGAAAAARRARFGWIRETVSEHRVDLGASVIALVVGLLVAVLLR